MAGVGPRIDPKRRLTPLWSAQEFGHQAKVGGLETSELHSGLAPEGGADKLSYGSLSSLREYSITTVEELLALDWVDRRSGTDYVREIGISPRFAEQLGRAFVESASGREEIQDWERFEQYEYSTGLSLDESEEPPLPDSEPELGAVLGTSAPQPDAVNLIGPCMPAIRDQEVRGTCTVFASVACLEYYLCSGGRSLLNLSEQFQYWSMVDSTGRHSLKACFHLLRDTGVCREETWPYYGEELPGNDSHAPPPPAAVTEASGFKCLEVLQMPPRSSIEIKGALSQGRLVAIGMPVYGSWMRSPVVRKDGNITMPLPGEVPDRVGHAVALVGFQDDADFSGGGFFILRNSWDSHWGPENPFGAGYGTLPYGYVQRYNWDAWCIIR